MLTNHEFATGYGAPPTCTSDVLVFQTHIGCNICYSHNRVSGQVSVRSSVRLFIHRSVFLNRFTSVSIFVVEWLFFHLATSTPSCIKTPSCRQWQNNSGDNNGKIDDSSRSLVACERCGKYALYKGHNITQSNDWLLYISCSIYHKCAPGVSVSFLLEADRWKIILQGMDARRNLIIQHNDLLYYHDAM